MVKKGDYLGRVAAKNKIVAEKKAYELFGITKRVKIHLEFIAADPPYKIYEATVIEIKPMKDPKVPKGWNKLFDAKYGKKHGVM